MRSVGRKATRFATLLSAFYVLLYRHGGQHDIVIGTTTGGRRHPDLVDSVGLFANTVAFGLGTVPDFHNRRIAEELGKARAAKQGIQVQAVG